jgi:excinuclease ABC subunit A
MNAERPTKCAKEIISNPRIIIQNRAVAPLGGVTDIVIFSRNSGEKYDFKITDAIEKIPAETMEMFE